MGDFMTVLELIEQLEEYPPHSKVMIAFDMDIRMEAEVAKPANYYDGDHVERVIVITDKDEWEDRDNW